MIHSPGDNLLVHLYENNKIIRDRFTSHYRLDHQLLFGKGARAPPPKARGETQTRHERAAKIEGAESTNTQYK